MRVHAKRADQGGHTLSETLIGVVVATIFAPVAIGIFAIAFGLLKFTDRAPTEVSYLITGELSRSAALVIPEQFCDNPRSEELYKDCVETANLPLEPFDTSPTNLCWLSLVTTPHPVHNELNRLKQCWSYDRATKQISVALSWPSNPADAHKHLKIKTWGPAHSTTSAATGIEAWAWRLYKEDLPNADLRDVVLVQIDVCASLTDEERGRAHLTDLPRCGPAFPQDALSVGIHLPPIFLTPGSA